MSNRLSLNGTLNLSVDENIYVGASLEGYCLDTNNTRYSIYGPQDGRTLFHNGSSDLSLSENLNEVNNVNWDNITIKYCKIDKMTIHPIDTEKTAKEITLNYEKSFN